MSAYIDWDREFNRHKPATPRPPSECCMAAESTGECGHCDARVCDDCTDYHCERHEAHRAKELLDALKARGFALRYQHESLHVVPADRLTANDWTAIEQVRTALLRLLGAQRALPSEQT